MNIGILLPGFSASEQDLAIPVQADLVRALSSSDDVRVLALRYPHRRARYSAFGARVISLGAGQARGIRRLLLWLDALRVLRGLHHEQPFHVLHAMWADETGLIAAWAGERLGVPVVVSVLGGELVRLDDIAYGLQGGFLSRSTVGQALAGADSIAVAGDYARAAMRDAGYAIPPEKVVVAPLGVDHHRFTPPAVAPLPKRLIHVASLVPVKDQATLLHAMKWLPTDVTLDMAGDGPEGTRLLRLAIDLGISARVRLLGTVPHARLPALYGRAALHVLSSRSEALPIAALEAAACGRPTVSTAVGALPDYPELAVTVPVGDAYALADAIRELLADEPRREALGQAARAAVESRFTIEAAARRFRDLYAGLAAKAR